MPSPSSRCAPPHDRRSARLTRKKSGPKGRFNNIAWPSGLFRRLVDAFAERIPDKAGHGDRRADRLFGLLDRLSDALGGIMDIGLVEKADLLIEGLEAR